MSSSEVTLVTGASRGIGKALSAALLKRPNNVVVAAVRNPSTCTDLQSLPAGPGSKLIVTKIDSEIDSDASEAVSKLTAEHGISHLDTVVANAAVGDYVGPVASLPAEKLVRYFQINSVAPLVLFQATQDLLKKSASPKFFFVSSVLASLTLTEHRSFPGAGYGAAKAAANYLMRKIHFENEWLTAVVLSPGMVQTDMGAFAAKVAGMEQAPVTLEDCIEGLLRILGSMGLAC